MKEEFLHHIWKTKKFDLSGLSTTDGEGIVVHNFGIHNSNAGPDFLDCMVTIGLHKWVGHVEIHLRSSDWNNHKHQHDKAYNNVILHVVYNYDKPILNEQGQALPTLELISKIPLHYISDYNSLTSALTWVPCAQLLPEANKDKVPFFLEKLLVNRLIRKQARITALLENSNNDWEAVLYKLLMQYFGLKINGDAFLRLTEIAPLSLVQKQEGLLAKESLLLGQANFLQGQDLYAEELHKEYKHQVAKYDLHKMTGVEWKFARLRPANFPTLRIAQAAALYQQTPQLFNEIITEPTLEKLHTLLSVKPSDYWKTHFLLGKVSPSKTKSIGATTRQVIIINAIVPLIFNYAQLTQNDSLKEKALDILYEMKPEKNNILTRWKTLGVTADSAAQSQGLIELKTEFCDKQKCLDCMIGQQLIFGKK